jgi:hypothetical protein
MKPIIFDDFHPLANAAGEKRIKLTFVMDLSDNQLIGIPEWLDGAITLVRKADNGSALNKSIVELDGVILRFYKAADDEKPEIEMQGVLLKNFVVRRSSKTVKAGELADSEMSFDAYVWYLSPVWRWAEKYFNRTALCAFGTTQAKLSFGPVKKDGVPDQPAEKAGDLPFDGKAAAAGKDDLITDDEPLQVDESDPESVFTTHPGETDEEARKRALDPKHDPLIDPGAGKAKGAGKGGGGNTLAFKPRAGAAKKHVN